MLINIKSLLIFRKIFSFLNEILKLKIFKINHQFQSKININLSNYQIASGKYIIFTGNYTVKEYNRVNDKLIFEGEYKNRERNGKGKEYYINDAIMFEGEYSNGKRNGKGKIYYDDGSLKFEGEFLNGKKWNGKGYDMYKNVVYELKEGKGLVKEYNENDQLIFEGNYINGEKNGKGTMYDRDRDIIFSGEFLNDKKWNGKGYNKKKIIYELKDGKGKVKEYKYGEKEK